jgi:hypothetical protein
MARDMRSRFNTQSPFLGGGTRGGLQLPSTRMPHTDRDAMASSACDGRTITHATTGVLVRMSLGDAGRCVLAPVNTAACKTTH